MNLPKVQGFTVVLILLLVMSGIGFTVLYAQNTGSAKERSDLTARVAMAEALNSIQARAWSELVRADENLTQASIDLRSTGLNGTAARTIMNGLRENLTYGVDIVTVDVNGTIVAAEPSYYQGSEGRYIGDQAQVVRLHQTLMPVMSKVFAMVEGFEAADMQVPVFDQEGRFIGSVSVTLNLQEMLKDIVNEELAGTSFQFTCLQTDGTELYDTDEGQIGRNLFTDPIYQNYTETLTFMRQVVQTPQGHGAYQYYRSVASGELVNKEVYWSSFGLYGTEWRLLMIRAM
jgi:hypothetical protein